ncbi:RES domain-containing protein [Nocardioides cheoyonin]|uniref:RES domain-containing protein n=1 Tax=Nocardioides cheoyonin TaxID=3156615 RepID=UPI003CCC7FAD
MREPPARIPGAPVVRTLSEGTRLFRVHGDHPADSFNPIPRPTLLHGGRFDALVTGRGYTYVGEDPDAAIAETVCRDLPVGGGVRQVPRKRVQGRRITAVEITRICRSSSSTAPRSRRSGPRCG